MTETNVNAWTEFKRRADDFLESQLKIKRSDPSINFGWIYYRDYAHFNAILNWTTGQSYRHHQDNSFRKKLFGEDVPPLACPIENTKENFDDKIFDSLKQSLMWLYDPCVQKRLCKADQWGDAEFLKKMAAVFLYRAKKFADTRLDINKIRNFLIDLADYDILDLKDQREEEMRKAFDIIKRLIKTPPEIDSLKNLDYLRDFGKFQRKCLDWSFPPGLKTLFE